MPMEVAKTHPSPRERHSFQILNPRSMEKFLDESSALGKFVKFMRLHEWLEARFILEPKELVERVKSYSGIIANAGGLLTGLTFVVVTNQASFVFAKPEILSLSRADVYAGTLICSFLLSLLAFISACGLFGYANLAGIENIQKFTETFWFLFDVPITVLAMATACMLLAGIVFVGGQFSDAVWYASAVVGGFTVITCLLILCSFRFVTHRLVHESMKFVRRQSAINHQL